MNAIWTREQAKQRFDYLIENALNHQQQIIQLNNRQQVLLISLEDYLKPKKPPLGKWLIDNLHGFGELTLPDRNEIEREIPFQ